MSFRIASFNIQKFSYQSVGGSKGQGRKDLETLAQIIRDNKFDIIAIQEIFHPEALKALLEKISQQYAEDAFRNNKDLGTFNMSSRTRDSYGYRTKHWEGRWAKPHSDYGDRIAEGYAFIWNRDRIRLVTNAEGKVFEPRISIRSGKKLVRPPFVGRFMPINGRYEFRIINTHIVYRSPAGRMDNRMKELSKNPLINTENVVSPDDIALRRIELKELIDNVYVDQCKKVYDVTGHDKNARMLVPYTFLLGDYNLYMEGSNSQAHGASLGKLEKRQKFYPNDYPMCITTFNKELTTLKAKPKDPEEAKRLRQNPILEAHLSNNFDHVTYDTEYLKRQQIAPPQIRVIHAFACYDNQETEEDSKFDLYRKYISDHLPICFEFDIKQRDS